MFGIGFLNSIFLFALATMALPIIIHILNRRRLRKIPFSTLEFIFELSRRRMSKINLRRWIVLLLRTLAVVFVVVAFARPTLPSKASLFMPGQAAKHVVLCLDQSSSMSAERKTGTAFTQAQEIAKRVVDESGKNDLFNVVAYASRSEMLFEKGTRNKQIVKNLIDALEVSNERGSLGPALEAAVNMIMQSDVNTGEVYVISDFREVPDSVLVGEAPETIRIILLPVYREAVDNVSIDRVLTPRKLIRPGEVVRVGVTLTNHSRENAAEFPLGLVIDGKRKAEKFVNLSPMSSATVTFAVSLNQWGAYRCRVTKDRDRLPIDDDRFFLLEISQKIPVTLIRGRKFVEQDNKQVAAYFYVEKALNPRGSGEGEFGVDAIDEKDLTAAKLHHAGVVVWTEPQRLDNNRFGLLRRHVEGGGTVMIFLGAQRGGFWQDADFARFIGIQKAVPMDREGGGRFSSFAKDHPIFSMFSEEELELLARSRIRRYMSVSGVAPDSILAYLAGGDPGMWECRRGKGRVVVVAAAPEMTSGDLSLSPMFLPLVHTSVSYLASTERAESPGENHAGEDLVFDLGPDGSAQGWNLRVMRDGEQAQIPIVFDSQGGGTRAMLPRASHVGFYKLVADTATIAEATVNVDARESNLNPQILDERHVGSATVLETSGDFARTLQSERQGREVYGLFLLLAVSALVLESLLGRKA